MSREEFEQELLNKLNGKKFKTKTWSNYIKSIFYYYADDNLMQNEIGIYTDKNTCGIYV